MEISYPINLQVSFDELAKIWEPLSPFYIVRDGISYELGPNLQYEDSLTPRDSKAFGEMVFTINALVR